MDSELLETVIKAAYDKGYKTGYTKAIKDKKLSKNLQFVTQDNFSQKLWLTPKEFKEEFNIPLSSQSKMRMNKKIPYHKIGNYVRYKRTDIDMWFNAGKIV